MSELKKMKEAGWKIDKFKLLTQFIWIMIFYALIPSMWLLIILPENQVVSLMLYYFTYHMFRRFSAPPMYQEVSEDLRRKKDH